MQPSGSQAMPSPRLLVVDVTAVGVGGEPLARRKRIAAGAMEGELAARTAPSAA